MLLLAFKSAMTLDHPTKTNHNKFFLGYSYTLTGIGKLQGFYYTNGRIPRSEVYYELSKIFYGLRVPIAKNYDFKFVQYFKYVPFFDYSTMYSNIYPGAMSEQKYRVVTDLEFGINRRLKIKKANWNVGLSYRWFYRGSEYSYSIKRSDGTIDTYNFDYNYEGWVLSTSYENKGVELGCNFNVAKPNDNTFLFVKSKFFLLLEFKGVYFLGGNKSVD